MKASEILAAVVLSPLGIFGGFPGVIAFAVGIIVLVVANVAKERERGRAGGSPGGTDAARYREHEDPASGVSFRRLSAAL